MVTLVSYHKPGTKHHRVGGWSGSTRFGQAGKLRPVIHDGDLVRSAAPATGPANFHPPRPIRAGATLLELGTRGLFEVVAGTRWTWRASGGPDRPGTPAGMGPSTGACFYRMAWPQPATILACPQGPGGTGSRSNWGRRGFHQASAGPGGAAFCGTRKTFGPGGEAPHGRGSGWARVLVASTFDAQKVQRPGLGLPRTGPGRRSSTSTRHNPLPIREREPEDYTTFTRSQKYRTGAGRGEYLPCVKRSSLPRALRKPSVRAFDHTCRVAQLRTTPGQGPANDPGPTSTKRDCAA